MIDRCNHSSGIICGSCQQKNADEGYLTELNETIDTLRADLAEALEMLNNVSYWETCPQEYKDRIARLQKEVK